MCHAWWGTLGVYSYYHGDCEHLTWVLDHGTEDSPPVPIPPPFPTSQLPESLFWPRPIGMPHLRSRQTQLWSRFCNVKVPPEKHVVNVVKIIIKMMRRMTWASIHEWPKSSVKSGALLFFWREVETSTMSLNEDNGSTEQPSCQCTICTC